MNTKTTITVVVIALALGVFFIVFETDLFNRQLPSNRERQPATEPEQSGKTVLAGGTLTADKVKRIKLERPDEPPIVIEKQDKSWVQTEPVKFALQSWDIDRLVTGAAELRSTQQFRPADKK